MAQHTITAVGQPRTWNVKPYYEEDGITIYHGDCREMLPTLATSISS
jgi:hypothetical protein